MEPVVISVLYNKLGSKLENETFDRFFNKVPPFIQAKIVSFRKWQDAQRCLIGNILLMEGLKMINKSDLSLDELKFTGYKRPYFNDSFDFNVSHSGQYVMCAVSETSRVGIDVEEIQSIEINDFENEFSLKERQQILQSDKSLYTFFSLWTQKEAFLKAIGTGLYVPLNKIKIEENKIKWNGKEWFLYKIKLGEEYLSHLATNIDYAKIEVIEINID